MNKPISIIIPTYKRTDWLIDCLHALSKQTISKEQFEVIAVDDSSPNQDEKKKRVLSETYPFTFHYFVQPKGGPAKARNFGIQQANGEFILFTDDDAIPSESWVAELYHSLQNSSIGGVSGRTLSHRTDVLTERYLDHVNHLSKHHFGSEGELAYIITVNAGFHKHVLKQVGGFDEDFPFPSGEDMDLGFRIRAMGKKLVCNDRAIVFHRQRDTVSNMLRTWFIYGRGAYMCAVKNQGINYQGVTSANLGFGKVFLILKDYFRQISTNLVNPQMKWMDRFLFPQLELANHVSYQIGRHYERLVRMFA